jgi:two-component system alkaline phosphatase synthesis response regulator PhoP
MRKKKILVIEDDSELLELLGLNLKHAGFAVITANNGCEALNMASDRSPDLIVLDLVLPELDGFAVCEILRRNSITNAIPIIVLSGLNSEFARFASLESGADEYVTKPVKPDWLVSRIKHWLRHSARPRQVQAQREAGADA